MDQVVERRMFVLATEAWFGGDKEKNIMAEFVILSWNLNGGTGENNELASLG